jgi:membrane protease YdiL (CAAX protease family)
VLTESVSGVRLRLAATLVPVAAGAAFAWRAMVLGRVLAVLVAVALVALARTRATSFDSGAAFAAAAVLLVVAVWPAGPVVVLGLGILACVPDLRRRLAPAPVTRQFVVMWLAIVVAGVVAALVWWRHREALTFYVFPPSWLPSRPVWTWAAVLVGAFANATYEEMLWRGALFRPVGRSVRAGAAASSVGFGLAHLHGLPGGPTGAALTFALGLLLCLVVVRQGGRLVWAIAAHVVLDILLLGLVGGAFGA